MRPLRARFASGREAGSVLLRLASLRAAELRLERLSAAEDGEFAEEPGSEDGSRDRGKTASGQTAPDGLFKLSAVVPASALDLADRLIRDAGGQPE